MKRIVVVTGASSGMGREFARQIAQKQPVVDEIWAIARRKDRLEALAAELPVPVRQLALDLTKPEDLQQYAALLQQEKPTVKILCNCAGYGKLSHYENETLETYLDMIDLNIKAVVSMVNYTLPYLLPGSKIMNLDSCVAFQPLPYVNVYGACKAFILRYSQALNRELRYRGIHVLAVCPFWVRTEFFDHAIKPGETPVVIHYGAVYKPEKVIRRALKDLYSSRSISVYGVLNRAQSFCTKLLPHDLVMSAWMRIQKLDGTPRVR